MSSKVITTIFNDSIPIGQRLRKECCINVNRRLCEEQAPRSRKNVCVSDYGTACPDNTVVELKKIKIKVLTCSKILLYRLRSSCLRHVVNNGRIKVNFANKRKIYGLNSYNIHLEIYTKTISRLRLGDYKLIFTSLQRLYELVITSPSATIFNN